jgi:hypothetical protein
MKMHTEQYKGFEITLDYSKDRKLFHARSVVGSSFKKYINGERNHDGGHLVPEHAINDVKSQIDKFLQRKPKTYKELTKMIDETLVPYYDDWIVDEQIITHLVESFIEERNKNDMRIT